MTTYIKYRHKGTSGTGIVEGETIEQCGDKLFENPERLGRTLKLDEVEILPPCTPGKFLGLWNNFYSRADKEGWGIPPEPLYFVKTPNSYNAHAQTIQRPKTYHGRVFFEAELGIVIGKHCAAVSEVEAANYIFGYTCVNDVTALDILIRDPSFPQWTRSKGFDTFGVFGPGITTGIQPDDLVIQAILDGKVKQSCTVGDMIFSPAKLVSLISQDMTLEPGDLIACGTASGSGEMRDGQSIEIKIEGVGSLVNVMSG